MNSALCEMKWKKQSSGEEEEREKAMPAKWGREKRKRWQQVRKVVVKR